MRLFESLLAVAIVAVSGCGKSDDGAKTGTGKGHAHDHGHEEGGQGVLSKVTSPDGADAGFLELKLHADKGDLEVWIGTDEKLASPFDLPLDTKVTVTFLDRDNRTVQLAARNRDRNEDEDGKANVRGGKTNYFIFPATRGRTPRGSRARTSRRASG